MNPIFDTRITEEQDIVVTLVELQSRKTIFRIFPMKIYNQGDVRTLRDFCKDFLYI